MARGSEEKLPRAAGLMRFLGCSESAPASEDSLGIDQIDSGRVKYRVEYRAFHHPSICKGTRAGAAMWLLVCRSPMTRVSCAIQSERFVAVSASSSNSFDDAMR